MPEGMGGSDVWIRLHVLEEDVLDAVEFVAAVEVDIDEDLGVSILTTTGALEEAA